MRLIVLLATLASGAPSLAQTFTFEVSGGPVLIDPSAVVSDVDVSIACDVPGTPTGGVQLCFAWNSDELQMFGAQDLAADPQSGPAFFSPYFTNGIDTTTPGGPYGPGVGYVAVLWDFLPANFLTFDVPTPMLRLQVYSGPLATPGPAIVSFVSGLNLPGQFTPILQVGYVDDTGQTASYNAPDFPGVLSLVEFPTFVRGDTNEDGVLNLIDCIRILEIGFISGTVLPGCVATADANGDGSLGPLPDCIFLLAYLFQGQAPPPGGPGCASNDTLGLSCDVAGCP